MPDPRVLLITGKFTPAPSVLQMMQDKGWLVVHHLDERLPIENDQAFAAEMIVTNRLFDLHAVDQFPRLKYLQLTSAGQDQIQAQHHQLEGRGITIKSAGSIYSTPIAELVVGRILELLKNLRTFNNQQQQHAWKKLRDLPELSGQTAAIIGYGSIGQAIAKRLKAFDVRILGVGRRLTADEICDGFYLIDQLDDALSQSDLVILTLPLTDQTHHLFDRNRLQHCKEQAIVINVARGAIIDEPALIDQLQAGHLGGAILDVFETEPLSPESPLWDLDQVLITPHNAFASQRIDERLSDLIRRNFEDYCHD